MKESSIYKVLLLLARRRAMLLSAALLAIVLGTFLKLAPLAAIYFLTLEIMSKEPSGQAVRNIVLWTLLAVVLRWVLVAAGNALAHMAAYGLLYDLRIDIARRLTRLPLGYVLNQDSGALKRVLQEEIERLEMFLGHMLPDAASALAMILGGGILLFAADPVLALAAFAPLPAALGLQAILWRGSGPVMTAYGEAAGQMNANIVEFIRAMPVIKTFGQRGPSIKNLSASIQSFQDLVADFSYKFVPAWMGFVTVIGSGLLFILPVGGWRVMGGHTDPATLVLFMLVGVGLMQHLVEIMAFGNQMRALMASLERIRGVMTAPVLETPEKGPVPDTFDLAFDNVSFAYEKESLVIKDLSLVCRAGQTTAVVGPSGAGKTTLAQLANRFWDPAAGTVAIGGIPLSRMDDTTLGRMTSSVFQDVFLFRDTVMGNIRAGRPSATRDQVKAAAKAAQIHDEIIRLPDGYDTLLGERGARLSGGQKQRLSIARALLKDTPVIILDEATAYADPLNEHRIHQAVQRLCRGRTVLIIAHRLSSIRNADKIAVMEKGRIVDQGSHPVLLKRCPLYQRLWSAWETAQGVEPAPHLKEESAP